MNRSERLIKKLEDALYLGKDGSGVIVSKWDHANAVTMRLVYAHNLNKFIVGPEPSLIENYDYPLRGVDKHFIVEIPRDKYKSKEEWINAALEKWESLEDLIESRSSNKVDPLTFSIIVECLLKAKDEVWEIGRETYELDDGTYDTTVDYLPEKTCLVHYLSINGKPKRAMASFEFKLGFGMTKQISNACIWMKNVLRDNKPNL